MAVEQDVAEITRESSYDLRLDSIIVRNLGGSSFYLKRPNCVEILERYPDGRYNSDNGVLTIEKVVYNGVKKYSEESRTRTETYVEDLTFDEYVELGRKETIHVIESTSITS